MRRPVGPPSPDASSEPGGLDQAWKELASQFGEASVGVAAPLEEAGPEELDASSVRGEPGRGPRRMTQAYPVRRLALAAAQPIPAQLLDALGELARQDDASRPQQNLQVEAAAGPARAAVEAGVPDGEVLPASPQVTGLLSPSAAEGAASSLSPPLVGEVGGPEAVPGPPSGAVPAPPRAPRRVRWLLPAVLLLLGAAALPALRWVALPEEVPAPPRPPSRAPWPAMDTPDAELLALPPPIVPALPPATGPQPDEEAAAEDDLRARLRAVRALLSTHRREAMRKLEELRRAAPRHPEVHIAFGDAALARGQAAQAIGHYEQALRLQPRYPPALFGLARAHGAAGHLRRALSLFETYLRRHPHGPRAEQARQEAARLRTAARVD